jgi:Zn ribbon nucleic-acid-binding protein
MITEQIKTPHSTRDTSYKSPSDDANKKPIIVASKNVLKKLIDDGICSNCFQKDPMIYPGSPFNLCIPCDKKQLGTKKKLEEHLISLGICPQCKQKDSILHSSSLFRTCIKCDIAINLKIPTQDSKK